MKQSLCACVGCILILNGEKFFHQSYRCFALLRSLKFILSFDGLSGYEEGKLLARVTMAVLRLVQMIAYLKDGGLY